MPHCSSQSFQTGPYQYLNKQWHKWADAVATLLKVANKSPSETCLLSTICCQTWALIRCVVQKPWCSFLVLPLFPNTEQKSTHEFRFNTLRTQKSTVSIPTSQPAKLLFIIDVRSKSRWPCDSTPSRPKESENSWPIFTFCRGSDVAPRARNLHWMAKTCSSRYNVANIFIWKRSGFFFTVNVFGNFK